MRLTTHFFNLAFCVCWQYGWLCNAHRRRFDWKSGGRMANAEGGLVPHGVRYGEGCPFRSRLGGLGSVVRSPRGVRGSLRRGGHRTLLFVPIWQNLRGTICISVPYSKFWGTCPLVPRVIYAHGCTWPIAVIGALWILVWWWSWWMMVMTGHTITPCDILDNFRAYRLGKRGFV